MLLVPVEYEEPTVPNLPSPTRPRRARRATASLSIAGALAAAGLAVLSPTSSAAEATVPITFKDCEVRKFPYTSNVRVKDNITWNTQIRLNHPSPIQARQAVTAEVEFMTPLPGGVFPETVYQAELDVEISFENGIVGPLKFVKVNQWLDTFNAANPLTIDEIEDSYQWYDPDLYPQRPGQLNMLLTGRDGADEFLEFSFVCDQQINQPSLFTLGVYDLTATPKVAIDQAQAKQGKRILVTGQNLLATAPTNPPAQATVTIGGIVAGTLPIDESGAIDGLVKVPDFVKPGTVQVRVSNGSKVATAALTVKAAKGKLKTTAKQVQRGKKITLKGSAFQPSEKVKIKLTGGRGTGTKSFTVTVRANKKGVFSRSVTLSQAAYGAWKVTVTGTSSGRVGRANFKVV